MGAIPGIPRRAFADVYAHGCTERNGPIAPGDFAAIFLRAGTLVDKRSTTATSSYCYRSCWLEAKNLNLTVEAAHSTVAVTHESLRLRSGLDILDVTSAEPIPVSPIVALSFGACGSGAALRVCDPLLPHLATSTAWPWVRRRKR